MAEEIGGAVYVFEARVEGVKRGMELIKSEFSEVQKEADRVAKRGAMAMRVFGDSIKELAGASANPARIAASWAKMTGQLDSDMERFSDAAKAQGITFAEMTQRLIYFKNESNRAARGVGALYGALQQYNPEAAMMIRLLPTQAQREALLNAVLAKTTDATARARIETAAFGLSMNEAGGKASMFSGALGGMGKAMAAFLTIEATRRGFAAIMQGIHDAAAIGDLAKNIGMTSEELQRMQFALQSTGTAVDQASNGLQTFAERLSDARRGEGELADLFAANGVALKDKAGNLLTTNQALLIFSDLVRNARTDEDALNMSVMAFGKSAGRDFVEAIRKGSSALVALGDQAVATGRIVSESQIEAADRIEERYNQLKARLNQGWMSIAVSAGQAFDYITDAAGQSAGVIDQLLGGLGLVAQYSNTLDKMSLPPGSLTQTPASDRSTALPVKSAKGADAGRDLQRQIDDYIASLQEEADALRLEVEMFDQSAAAKARAAAIARLPAEATEAEKQKALGLIAAISQETEALENLNRVKEEAQAHSEALAAAEAFVASELESHFFALLDKSQSVGDAFEDMSKRMIDAMLQALIFGSGPFADFFGSSPSGGSGLGGLLGGLGGLIGGLFKPTLYAKGGVFGRPTAFAHGGGLGVMGEAGPEAVMPLKRGRDGSLGVVAHDDTGARMAAILAAAQRPLLPQNAAVNLSPQINIKTINNAGADVQSRAVPNGSGGFDVETVINRHLASGAADRVMDARFGVRRRPEGWG